MLTRLQPVQQSEGNLLGTMKAFLFFLFLNSSKELTNVLGAFRHFLKQTLKVYVLYGKLQQMFLCVGVHIQPKQPNSMG